MASMHTWSVAGAPIACAGPGCDPGCGPCCGVGCDCGCGARPRAPARVTCFCARGSCSCFAAATCCCAGCHDPGWGYESGGLGSCSRCASVAARATPCARPASSASCLGSTCVLCAPCGPCGHAPHCDCGWRCGGCCCCCPACVWFCQKVTVSGAASPCRACLPWHQCYYFQPRCRHPCVHACLQRHLLVVGQAALLPVLSSTLRG